MKWGHVLRAAVGLARLPDGWKITPDYSLDRYGNIMFRARRGKHRVTLSFSQDVLASYESPEILAATIAQMVEAGADE